MSRQSELAELSRIYDSSALSNRNLIINGAMQVAQRATSATAVSGAGVYDTIDRLKLWKDNDGAYTSEQSTTAPAGFGTSVKFQVTTADTSIAAAQYSCIAQIIEAQNLQHLSYGTSAAKDITVSFYVRSNKTGTYGFSLEKSDSTRYIFIKEFTINAADTWERKIITISADSQIKASGGAIANDNGNGFRAFIFLAAGSDYHGTNNVWNTNTSYFTTSNQVNWMDSTSNNFYLTGMQLEVGDSATPFEHPRSYGDELARCQRYYYEISGNNTLVGHGFYFGSSEVDVLVNFPVPMRASPSVTSSNNTGDFIFQHHSDTFDTWTGVQYYNGDSLNMFVTSGVSGTGGQAGYAKTNTSTGKLQFSSEL